VNLELPALVFSSPHKVHQLSKPSTLPPPQVVPTGARSVGNPVRVTEELETLQERFCEAVQNGRPVIATYSWIYGRVFASVPLPWSHGHALKISTQAHSTRPRILPGLGAVALDTFIVSARTRRPSHGYWPVVLHDEQQWQRTLGQAQLLHGAAKGPGNDGRHSWGRAAPSSCQAAGPSRFAATIAGPCGPGLVLAE
jgi:hypothetical protein